MDMTRSETERTAEDGVLRLLANTTEVTVAIERLADFGAFDIDATDAEGLALALGVVRGVGRTAAPIDITAGILARVAGGVTGLPAICVGHALAGGEVSVASMPEGALTVIAFDDSGASLWEIGDLELVAKGGFDAGCEVTRWRPRAGAQADRLHAAPVAMVRLALVDAEMIAAAEEMIARTLDHLKTRMQFGRPIGTFQALQHRIADAHVAVQAAGLACDYAAALIHVDDAGKALAWLRACHAYSAEAATRAAQTCFQLHGGMAFTAEFWPHRWLRRVFRLAADGGPPERHYQLAARYIRSEDDLGRFITHSGREEVP